MAVVCKGYECFFEAGPQTILQTYIQLLTNWPFFHRVKKGYLLEGGKYT